MALGLAAFQSEGYWYFLGVRRGELFLEKQGKTIASRELKRKDTGASYGSVTVSIGVSMLNPRYDRPDDLISRADKALYMSKKNGRNRITVEEL